MSWKRFRSVAFPALGGALLLVSVWVGDPGNADTPVLRLFVALSMLLALLVVVDVAYHSWRGEGQACRNCGHLRRMKPFRAYGPCPNCGD